MNPPADARELQDLIDRLETAEETLRAIRAGEVDAVVVNDAHGERVFTLEGADRPYRVLIEAMQQGAVTLSEEGMILYCNRRFAQLVQSPHEDVIGSSVKDFLAPEEGPRLDSLLRVARNHPCQDELEFRGPGGSSSPLFLALCPLSAGEGSTVCMVVTDLTEQKNLRDLQETDRRKDEFLAMLAHELRNPLAPILNAIQIMQLRGSGDPHLEWTCQVIQRQTQQLVRLVDDLLEVSRMTRGMVQLRRELVELAPVIQQAIESSQPQIELGRHQLELSLPEEPIRLNADPVRLAQVFANLLNNAAKYMEPGGTIWLEARMDGEPGGPADEVVVRVRDAGIGISADMLPRIFNLFTQVDHSLDRSKGGLGIGLSLVRSLVHLHGGSVVAHSDGEGRGSEFVVRLPATVATPGAALPQAPAEPRAPGAPLRILVVDDNVDAAQSLALLLRCRGHEASTAIDGETAIVAALERPPDLLLLDIGLPGKDGYEVCMDLKHKPGLERTKLVALTGYGQEKDRHRSREAGFHDHLVKPVSIDQLQGLIEGLVAQREAASD